MSRSRDRAFERGHARSCLQGRPSGTNLYGVAALFRAWGPGRSIDVMRVGAVRATRPCLCACAGRNPGPQAVRRVHGACPRAAASLKAAVFERWPRADNRRSARFAGRAHRCAFQQVQNERRVAHRRGCTRAEEKAGTHSGRLQAAPTTPTPAPGARSPRAPGAGPVRRRSSGARRRLRRWSRSIRPALRRAG